MSEKVNPLEMSDGELKSTLSKFLMLGGKPMVEDYLESWGAEHLIEKISLSTKIDVGADKVRLKSTKTEFIKVYVKELRELREHKIIDHTLLGVLTELSSLIRWEDNVLRDENNKPYSQKQLAEILGVNERTAKRYFKKLFDCGLVLSKPNPKKKNSKMFFLNFNLFYKGIYVETKLKTDINEYYENVKIKNKENVDDKVEV